MIRKETQDLYVRRIDRTIERLNRIIIKETFPFEIRYHYCGAAKPCSELRPGDLKPIREGDLWGKQWEFAWFHLEATVPPGWKEEKVVACLDFGGEGLVHDSRFRVLQGISNGSIFDHEFGRDLVVLYDPCRGGETVELWVEASANGMFGVFTDADPADAAADRYGHYSAKVEKCCLGIFDEAAWHFMLDLRIVAGLLKRLPEKSVRFSRLLHAANEAIDIYSRNVSLGDAQARLAEELSKPAGSSDLSVTAVGHAHIDTAWLWPVSQTRHKCVRTFANQLDLIERYPDYIFGASQPQHYQFVRESHPELFEKIRATVEEGRWELQGGMWVEADCNLISGESMIRQILHGKNYFRDEFGVEVDNLWLPDVFGYSAALPQIMRRSGLNYFLTQKISWNQMNDFPFTSFFWQGIDGSEVIAHFPPENTYNSSLDSASLLAGRDNFREKAFLDEFLSLFGMGDGGGGPKAENIEFGRRMTDCEGAPRVRFGRADEFFHRLEQHRTKLPRWVGELYLELHRGTLTTQAEIKKQNRSLETMLQNCEMILSLLPQETIPGPTLDQLWKTVLRNQFHDILPGSSITETYRVTRQEYRKVRKTCEELNALGAGKLFEKRNGSLVAFNPTHYPFHGLLPLPEEWKGCRVAGEKGNQLTVQLIDEQSTVFVEIPPYSFLNLVRDEEKQLRGRQQGKSPESLVLENDLIRYQFAKDGRVLEAFDKAENRQLLEEPGGNLLEFFDDHPNDWDAWDIDLFYERCLIGNAEETSPPEFRQGEAASWINFYLALGQSTIQQRVLLAENSRELKFQAEVDWRESHKMLRVAFPTTIMATEATFDIQYGYLRRPTHSNTSWDLARFETVAHKYVDLSEADYGVALLNDGKYGHRVHHGRLEMTLLRSPSYPDPDADRGSHSFTYCLYPHTGGLLDSDVIAKAVLLNRPPVIFDGYHSNFGKLPWRLEGDGLSLETVKPAEKENCLILRIVETLGKHSSGFLHLPEGSKLAETDLMEWQQNRPEQVSSPVEMKLKPFEIRTCKLWMK